MLEVKILTKYSANGTNTDLSGLYGIRFSDNLTKFLLTVNELELDQNLNALRISLLFSEQKFPLFQIAPPLCK